MHSTHAFAQWSILLLISVLRIRNLTQSYPFVFKSVQLKNTDRDSRVKTVDPNTDQGRGSGLRLTRLSHRLLDTIFFYRMRLILKITYRDSKVKTVDPNTDQICGSVLKIETIITLSFRYEFFFYRICLI